MVSRNHSRANWSGSCFIFILLVVFASTDLYGGGAWVRRTHGFYAEMALGYYRAGDFFNRNGERRNLRISKDPENPAAVLLGLENSTYLQLEAGVYLEYGIRYNLEFSLNFTLQAVAQQDSDIGKFQVNGIRDATFGIKYQWLRRAWLLSAIQLEVGIPIGDAGAQGSSAGQAPQPIPLGDNEWDFALRLYISRSFYPAPVYVTADIGYRFRTHGTNGANFDDDIQWSVEAGYTFKLNEGPWFSNLTTILAVRGLFSTAQREAFGFGTIDVTGFSSQQDALDFQAGFSFELVRQLALLGNLTYNLAGENTGAGWGIRFGASFAR